MNKSKKIMLSLVLVMAITIGKSYAQPSIGGPGTGQGGDTGYGNANDVPGGVPFDGGLSLILLAAGAGLGAKKRKMLNA